MNEKNHFLAKYGTLDHLDEVLSKKPDLWYAAKDNPNLHPGHLNMVWDAAPSEHRYLVDHPMFSGDRLHQAAKSNLNWAVREKALRNPNIKTEYLIHGLDDPHPNVRGAALYHAHMTQELKPEHYEKMLKDPDLVVRSDAQELHTEYKKWHGGS